VNADPQTAAKNYEAIVSNFDRQREVAAQAIVRLGEAYRRMGRIDEARAMYARILREFVDFPDLARVSQQLLTENAPTQIRENATLTTGVPTPAEEEFIREELKLLEEQLVNAKALTETGQTSTNSLLPIRREILQLKQRLARAQTQNSPSAPTAPNYYGKHAAGSSSQSYRSSASRSETDRLKGEVRELENQIEVLSEGKQLEAMSTQVIKDPRFAELKSDYEKKFLSVTGDKESVEAATNAQERLTRWIQEIYLPELKSTLAIKTSQLREAMAEAEARSKRIEH
jgi:TolA-binding protein